MTRELSVELGDRSYKIHIGSGLLKEAGDLVAPFASSKRVFIICDLALADTCLKLLETSLANAGLTSSVFLVQAGESSKGIITYNHLLTRLIEHQAARDDLIIALGGGVVGDLAGFVAATLLRGIDLIQIPTTLLSQVDSSVGGKTGINSPLGKNLIGAFHQPRAVITDIQTLETLDMRQLKAGYSEIVKYSCIRQPEFFDWLEEKAQGILQRDGSILEEAIYRSCRAKAEIVMADETETLGIRSLLNLGHTFAHALEAEGQYDDTILHGEAVSIGMSMAFDFSCQLGLCPEKDYKRLLEHFRELGLPTGFGLLASKKPTSDKLFQHMLRDKKARNQKPSLILLEGIGKAFQSQEINIQELKAFLNSCQETHKLG